MLAIFKKELRAYFTSAIGYVYIAIFLALSALLCCYTTIQANSYSTSTYFNIMIFVAAIILPLLTMRLFAEERKMRTEQMLLTAPISLTGMVLGKYFAAFTLFLSTALFSCINFFPIYEIGKQEMNTAYSLDTINNVKAYLAKVPHIGPVTGQIVGSVIGFILIGAAFIAIGLFISALTENQLSSAVITIAVILATIGLGLVAQMTDANGQYIIGSYGVRYALGWLSVLSRFSAFGYGYFDYAALIYYISVTGIFLFLTVRVYDSRRWA